MSLVSKSFRALTPTTKPGVTAAHLSPQPAHPFIEVLADPSMNEARRGHKVQALVLLHDLNGHTGSQSSVSTQEGRSMSVGYPSNAGTLRATKDIG